MTGDFNALADAIGALSPTRRYGQVTEVGPGSLVIAGLGRQARSGDLVSIEGRAGPVEGEIIALTRGGARAMLLGMSEGVGLGDPVLLLPSPRLRPDSSWIGRVLDASCEPLDGALLIRGPAEAPLRRAPPPAASRKPLGERTPTGLAAFDTMLPLARGQRIGIFAGSGIGKSSMLADLARGVEADVVVIALIGERGRELRHFTEVVLGPEGMARAVVVAATSDQSPLLKRRAAWSAMAVAEHFRDQGQHVLLLVDSITRFAEAHREVALTAGEPASLRAFPPSTANMIAALTERAGPGSEGTGDITAIFSVLVAGSDMEEPVADMTRGLLDGHVVLDRAIAERGRFPAIDVRRSVSRSLPDVASEEENKLILQARDLLGVYESAEPMIQTGLYARGSDPRIDRAMAVWPGLDRFFSERSADGVAAAFDRLRGILAKAP